MCQQWISRAEEYGPGRGTAMGRVAPTRGPRAQARAYAAPRSPAPRRTSAWISPEVQAKGGGAGEACMPTFVAGAASPAHSVGGLRQGATRQCASSPVSFHSPAEDEEGARQRHERDHDARREEERAADAERENARLVAQVHEEEDDQRELRGGHREQQRHDDRRELPDVDRTDLQARD